MKSSTTQNEFDSTIKSICPQGNPSEMGIQSDNRLKIRRNLFGSLDREATSEFLAQEFAILSERSCSDWNFDFLLGVPKLGRYLWENASPVECSVRHSSGQESSRVGHFESPPEEQRVSKETKTNFEKENTHRRESQDARKSLSRKVKKLPQKVLVQTSIKGFLKVRKPRCSKRLRMSRRKLCPTTKTSRPSTCSTVCYGTTKTR